MSRSSFLSRRRKRKKVGLFLDLSRSKTWAHEVQHFDKDAVIPAYNAVSYPYYWFSAEDLSGTAENNSSDYEVTTVGGQNLYKAAPDDTGKAFRIAFVPNFDEAAGSSFGVTKVWAPHQVRAKTTFFDESYDAEGNALSDNAYVRYQNVLRQYAANALSANKSYQTYGAFDLMNADDSQASGTIGYVTATNKYYTYDGNAWGELTAKPYSLTTDGTNSTGTDYGTVTISKTGTGAYTAAAAGSNAVLMDSASVDSVPVTTLLAETRARRPHCPNAQIISATLRQALETPFP